MRADLALWNVRHPAELCYWLGGDLLQRAFVAGAPIPER
jgi:imidazolonepropionase